MAVEVRVKGGHSGHAPARLQTLFSQFLNHKVDKTCLRYFPLIPGFKIHHLHEYPTARAQRVTYPAPFPPKVLGISRMIFKEPSARTHGQLSVEHPDRSLKDTSVHE